MATGTGTPPSDLFPSDSVRSDPLRWLAPLEAHRPLFALVDASRDSRVFPLLRSAGPQVGSLYAMPAAGELATVAPYLASVVPGFPLGRELVTAGWGAGWGAGWAVWLTSPADAEAVLLHFRRRLVVRREDGREVFFRFYDPRVLRRYLPTCTAEEAEQFFGPATSFVVEGPTPDACVRYTRGPTGVVAEALAPETLEREGRRLTQPAAATSPAGPTAWLPEAEQTRIPMERLPADEVQAGADRSPIAASAVVVPPPVLVSPPILVPHPVAFLPPAPVRPLTPGVANVDGTVPPPPLFPLAGPLPTSASDFDLAGASESLVEWIESAPPADEPAAVEPSVAEPVVQSSGGATSGSDPTPGAEPPAAAAEVTTDLTAAVDGPRSVEPPSDGERVAEGERGVIDGPPDAVEVPRGDLGRVTVASVDPWYDPDAEVWDDELAPRPAWRWPPPAAG